MDIKLLFGLLEGELVDISSVKSGLACNCVCPCCGEKLVAKKGEHNEHHFAHYNTEECKGATESALHILAKQILEKSMRITLPPVYLDSDDILLHPQTEIIFDRVVLERRIKNIIPDLIVYVKDKPLIIEIAVTHFVERKKISIISEMGYSAIEINAYGLFHSSFNKGFGVEEFENRLVNGIDYKRWINNLKANLFIEKVKKPILKKGVIDTNMNNHPLIVYDCPLNKRVWISGYKQGESYASVFQDCWDCTFGEIIRQVKSFSDREWTSEGKIIEVNCTSPNKSDLDASISRYIENQKR